MLQPEGNLLDGADVLRHILSRSPIATRRRLNQHALFVAQIDRQSVELELARVCDRGRFFGQPQFAPDPGIERLAPPPVMSVSVRIDSIGTRCCTLRKPGAPAADAQGRRILRTKLGVLMLDLRKDAKSRSYSASGNSGASST